MYDVITIGAATRDVFLLSDHFKVAHDKHLSTDGEVLYFNLGSKDELKDVVLTTGGGATNAAVTFARQGFKTACICRVGDEESGHDVVRALTMEKVSSKLIQHDKRVPTAYSTILTTQGGERVILVKRGASDRIQFSAIPLNAFRAKWLYISSLAGNLTLLKKILKLAKERHIKVAYNPGGLELKRGLKVLKPYLKQVDVFMVNKEEAAWLTGIPYQQEDKIFEVLDNAVSGTVIMTKGPEGVVVSDGTTTWRAGIPQSPIVGRTGAGDAFGSGFVAGMLHKNNVPFSIQLGTANSTSVIQHLSAKKGILYKGVWGKWSKVTVTHG